MRSGLLILALLLATTALEARRSGRGRGSSLEREVEVQRIDWLLLQVRGDLGLGPYANFFQLESLYKINRRVRINFLIQDFSLFQLPEQDMKRVFVEKIIISMAKLRFVIPEIEAQDCEFQFSYRLTQKDFMERYAIDLRARKIYGDGTVVARYGAGKLEILNNHLPWPAQQSDPRPAQEDWKSYQMKDLLVDMLSKYHPYLALHGVKYNARNDTWTLELVFAAQSPRYESKKPFKKLPKTEQKGVMTKAMELIRGLIVAIVPEIEKNPKKVNYLFRVSDLPEDNYAEFKDGKIRIF